MRFSILIGCLGTALLLGATALATDQSAELANVYTAMKVCIAHAKEPRFAELSGKVPTLQDNGGASPKMLSLTRVPTPRERKLLISYQHEVYDCATRAGSVISATTPKTQPDYAEETQRMFLRLLEKGKITFADFDLFMLGQASLVKATQKVDALNAKLTALRASQATAEAAQAADQPKYLVCHRYNANGRWVEDLNFEIDPQNSTVNGRKATFTPTDIQFMTSTFDLVDINRLSSTFRLVGTIPDVNADMILGSGPCQVATTRKF